MKRLVDRRERGEVYTPFCLDFSMHSLPSCDTQVNKSPFREDLNEIH